MTSIQTVEKTTTQTVTQEPEQITQQIEQGNIIEGQLQPVVTNEFQSSEEGANFQGMTNISSMQGQSQIEGVLNPIYTQEVKQTEVHDLGTVNLGTIDLGTKNLGTFDLGTKNLCTIDLGTQNLGSQEGSAQIEGVLNPIYTKEIKATQVHDLGTVDLGTVYKKEIHQGVEEEAEIEAVLKPIYTKEVRQAIIK